jgi:hypothetical protein
VHEELQAIAKLRRENKSAYYRGIQTRELALLEQNEQLQTSGEPRYVPRSRLVGAENRHVSFDNVFRGIRRESQHASSHGPQNSPCVSPAKVMWPGLRHGGLDRSEIEQALAASPKRPHGRIRRMRSIKGLSTSVSNASAHRQVPSGRQNRW